MKKVEGQVNTWVTSDDGGEYTLVRTGKRGEFEFIVWNTDEWKNYQDYLINLSVDATSEVVEAVPEPSGPIEIFKSRDEALKYIDSLQGNVSKVRTKKESTTTEKKAKKNSSLMKLVNEFEEDSNA